MPAKSLQERLTAAEALVAKYKAQIAQEAILRNIQVNDDVDFTYGRDATKRSLTGTVTGTRTDDNNVMWVAIASGEGFDLQTYKVRATDITENRTAAKRG